MPRISAAQLQTQTWARPVRLQPPAGLSAPEVEIWNSVLAGCAPGHFEPGGDEVLLAAFCRASVLERTAATELASRRPSELWLRAHASAVTALARLSVRLRLGPKSRSANVPSRRPASTSYYDRMGNGGA